jgi:hypothetical protein
MIEKTTLIVLGTPYVFEIERKMNEEGRFLSLSIRRNDKLDLFESVAEQEAREEIEKALIQYADQEATRIAQGYFLPLDPRSTITQDRIDVEFLYCFPKAVSLEPVRSASFCSI